MPIGEGMLSEMIELGRQELISANSGQPIEAPQMDAAPVEAPQQPSFEQMVASYADVAPAQSVEMER